MTESEWTTCRDVLALLAEPAVSGASRRCAPCSPLFRDVFGNPFRPVRFDLAWRTATAVAVAQAMYTSRTFDGMAVLGDALEEAGCSSAEVLTHCRQPGVHVRGCRAVDLALAKE